MLAKMIDKIVSLKETKIFEINGQTYADASLTRIPPHVDRPDCIRWVSGIPQPKGTTSTFSRVRVSYSFTVLLLSEKPSGPEPARRSIYCMTTTLPASIRSPMFFRK